MITKKSLKPTWFDITLKKIFPYQANNFSTMSLLLEEMDL